ncbi:Neuronal acetylcholine receptor subunit alpha-7 [Melipona quadrifasciata]|uniref:Neuronal acetylcholine receptor subunit alpha-7 n=2 Tax=Meliponini TaxID=83319 RepID=A0A0N0BEF5_9HYME|nr:Neuronal acetylcholine receptor subunit alpha-7 [Melipona quadrifasciata]
MFSGEISSKARYVPAYFGKFRIQKLLRSAPHQRITLARVVLVTTKSSQNDRTVEQLMLSKLLLVIANRLKRLKGEDRAKLGVEWNDVNMRWNTSDYGGVRDLRIPPHRLWKPDVLMYNSIQQISRVDEELYLRKVKRTSNNDHQQAGLCCDCLQKTCYYQLAGSTRVTPVNFHPRNRVDSNLVGRQLCRRIIKDTKLFLRGIIYPGVKCIIVSTIFFAWMRHDLQYTCSENKGSLETKELKTFVSCGKLADRTEVSCLRGSIETRLTLTIAGYSADEGFDGTYPTNVVVKNNGTCLYVPPGIFKSTCKIDITWFPFDDQRCEMKFGSWTYDGFQLDLQLQDESGGDISSFITNGEWDLLGVTILLSLTVFLNMVAETMPATSDAVPLLGTYFNCIMFMVASSVVSTILILNYHHRNADTHEMSEWVKVVFLYWLPCILRMSRPTDKEEREAQKSQKPSPVTGASKSHGDLELRQRSSKSLLANVLDLEDNALAHAATPHHQHSTPLAHSSYPAALQIGHTPHHHPHPPETPGPQVETILQNACFCARNELIMILKEIKIITDQLKSEEVNTKVTNDWKFAAMLTLEQRGAIDLLYLITVRYVTLRYAIDICSAMNSTASVALLASGLSSTESELSDPLLSARPSPPAALELLVVW